MGSSGIGSGDGGVHFSRVRRKGLKYPDLVENKNLLQRCNFSKSSRPNHVVRMGPEHNIAWAFVMLCVSSYGSSSKMVRFLCKSVAFNQMIPHETFFSRSASERKNIAVNSG